MQVKSMPEHLEIFPSFTFDNCFCKPFWQDNIFAILALFIDIIIRHIKSDQNYK